ncbi:Hypothetical protein NTJ_02206 [Nesidiocoris tenuis]|uniref:Uncharacterized protein n=1 Tax=Nesidiocoris tenuis TaxID=355587 RepID=A0ABN7AE07_9HEMI|nr:Hypothetical protein NTJ_02206 [Nesidiocoris tenuis]
MICLRNKICHVVSNQFPVTISSVFNVNLFQDVLRIASVFPVGDFTILHLPSELPGADGGPGHPAVKDREHYCLKETTSKGHKNE